MVRAERDPAALLPLTPASFLILLALARGVRHGYAIMQDVQEMTRGRTILGPGTLYWIIQRMVLDGLISEGEEPSAPDAERRRYYRLTSFGRRVGILETERHTDLIRAAVDSELGGKELLALIQTLRRRSP